MSDVGPLSYAGRVERSGVACERGKGWARVFLPRPPWSTSGRTLIEINASEVVLGQLTSSGLGQKRSWARERVSNFHRNVSNGKLIFHVTGQEFVEVDARLDQELTEWVTSVLNDALSEPANVEECPPLAPVDPAIAAARKEMGVVVAVVLVVLGVICLPWGFGIALLVIGAIIAGITLGMQDKDYFA